MLARPSLLLETEEIGSTEQTTEKLGKGRAGRKEMEAKKRMGETAPDRSEGDIITRFLFSFSPFLAAFLLSCTFCLLVGSAGQYQRGGG